MSSIKGHITQSQLLGTAYSLGAATTVVFSLQAILSLWRKRRFATEDYLLSTAYVFFLAMTILYIVSAPVAYRVQNVDSEKAKEDPTSEYDSHTLADILFTNMLLFWLALWSVKFTFLAMYRKLMKGFRVYMRLWWITLVFCFVALTGCIASNFTTCLSGQALWARERCTDPREKQAQIVSLYYSFAVDILSDVLIMALPLRLLYSSRRPQRLWLSIGTLLAFGWLGIAVAVIRVIPVEIDVNVPNLPSSSWLSLWAIIEGAIAIIIGCLPGLYASFTEICTKCRSTSVDNSGHFADPSNCFSSASFVNSSSHDHHASAASQSSSCALYLTPGRGQNFPVDSIDSHSSRVHSRVVSFNGLNMNPTSKSTNPHAPSADGSTTNFSLPTLPTTGHGYRKSTYVPIQIPGTKRHSRDRTGSLSGAFWSEMEAEMSSISDSVGHGIGMERGTNFQTIVYATDEVDRI